MESFPPNKKKIIIAVDGFSSCGKSTFAREVAARIGYIFIDTGAMYRAVTLLGLRRGAIGPDGVDEKALTDLLSEADISFRFNPGRGASDIYLDGENVESRIRGIEVSNSVSRVSSIGAVREKLVHLQQQMGKQKGVVMDGRDIGTVVLPNATVKIFLTATPEARAERRYKELLMKGEKHDYQNVLADVRARDYQDTHRAAAPLRQAEDAVLVDTSELNFDQSFEALKKVIQDRAK